MKRCDDRGQRVEGLPNAFGVAGMTNNRSLYTDSD